jgi:hypothetical protein
MVKVRRKTTGGAMMGKISTWLLAGLMAMLLGGQAAAAEQIIFESCDSRGQSVPARADSRLAVLVGTVSDQGRREIRYNPELLPRLSAHARLFFYAHQCARLALHEAANAARRADCVALNTLLDGGQLQYKDLPALQAELTFSAEEWSLLPGPVRQIDLSNCRASSGDVLRLPLASQPSARQSDWNTCVRACADRLWNCRKAGDAAGDNCQAAYDQCRSSCPE